MQGTQVWSPVQEDATCLGATKPTHDNYGTWALELGHSNEAPEQPKINKLINNNNNNKKHSHSQQNWRQETHDTKVFAPLLCQIQNPRRVSIFSKNAE